MLLAVAARELWSLRACYLQLNFGQPVVGTGNRMHGPHSARSEAIETCAIVLVRCLLFRVARRLSAMPSRLSTVAFVTLGVPAEAFQLHEPHEYSAQAQQFHELAELLSGRGAAEPLLEKRNGHHRRISYHRMRTSDGVGLDTVVINPYPYNETKGAMLVRSPYGPLSVFACVCVCVCVCLVLFEENSILPLPGRSEASGVKSVWGEVSQQSQRNR